MTSMHCALLLCLLTGALSAQAAAPPADPRVAGTLTALRVDEAPQPQRSNARWQAPRKVLLLAQGNAALAAQATAFGAVAPVARIVIATDRTMHNANLSVQGDMAAAMVLHRQDRYAESEVLLQRLAGYLF